MSIIYRDGTEAKHGDVIRWNCYDTDDFVMWTFTGIYKECGIVYMGGGIDFGLGIGQIMPIAEAIEQADANDEADKGFIKVGEARNLARSIRAWKETP